MKIVKRRPALEYKLVDSTEDLFGTIFNITPVAIVILSWPSKGVLNANKAALNLLKVRNVLSMSDKHKFLFSKFSEETFAGRDSFEIEVKARNPKGAVVYLIVKARKFEQTQVVLTLEDITKHRLKEKRLLKLAQMDGLTGILNHKTILERFKEEFIRAKRYHLPLSCFMFDVDNFKAVNDQYGHLEGDRLLKRIANTLRTNTRETDIVGRYGGDEFLVIMTETPLSESWTPAKRIHDHLVKEYSLIKSDKKEVRITFSIGISGFPMNSLDSVKDIINHADKGLYESKLKGGNQIVMSQA
ncbi:MAG: GGDEF domain-containing protein [Candidatus Omnitrophica bacterium]|nr:GGDEF domain-containing protein [Candidatus Omnitrophota bacterium]